MRTVMNFRTKRKRDRDLDHDRSCRQDVGESPAIQPLSCLLPSQESWLPYSKSPRLVATFKPGTCIGAKSVAARGKESSDPFRV